MADPSKMTPAELQTLLNGPGGKPPTGVTPNFDHPPNLKGALYAVSSICIIVATLAVFARVYTKARVIRSMGKEDYVAILAWLCFIGYGVALFFMYIDCPGVHQWNIRFKYLRRHFYNVHVASQMYPLAIFFTKASILLQLMRIFSPLGTRNFVWWSSNALMIACFLFYFITFMISFWFCHPVEKIYNPLVTGGKCYNDNFLYKFYAIFNAITDMLIAFIPQYSIWTLQASLKRKIGISSIFIMGLAGCAAAWVKLYFSIKLHADPNKDVAYWTSLVGLCVMPEVAAGLLAGALPSMPKFYQTCKTGLGSSMRSLLSITHGDSAWQTTQHSGDKKASSTWSDQQRWEEDKANIPAVPAAYHPGDGNQTVRETYEGAPIAENGWIRKTNDTVVSSEPKRD